MKEEKSTFYKGMVGEDIAVAYLKSKDYEIIERNWRVGEGELDIIVKQDNIIVFVEVKTAYSNKFGDPLEWVNKAKQRQIGKMSEIWIQRHTIRDCFFRFDVIALKKKEGGFELKHIEDAFML
ncbi:YraN family protein [bacterium]|nr:YraN family protein [bacterium]